MAYKKQTWVDLETPLDAEHMNHIEDGIGSISEEIVDQSDILSEFVVENAKNLVDPEKVEGGILSTKYEGGVEICYVSTNLAHIYDTTGPIPLKAGETITGYPYANRFAAFAKDMTYIKGSYLPQASDKPYEYTATVDCFVRFSFLKTLKYYVCYGYGTATDDGPGFFVKGERIQKKSIHADRLAETYIQNTFIGKSIMNFGDSIAESRSNNGGGYASIISSFNAMTLYDYAKGGATLTMLNTSNTIQSQIDTAITEHSGKSIDYILLEGGTNDVGSQEVGELAEGYDVTACDTLKYIGAVETAIYKLRNAFPLAKILFVSVHKMPTRDYAKQCAYHDAVIQSCAKWSVPVVDVFAEGGLNSYIDSIVTACFDLKTDGSGEYDKTHPNAVGYTNFYVPMIVAAMNSH